MLRIKSIVNFNKSHYLHPYFSTMKWTYLLFTIALIINITSCKQEQNTNNLNPLPEGKDLSKMIASDPTNAKLYAERAAVYYKNQVYKAAIDDLKDAIKLAPENPTYYHHLSDVYLDSYQSKKAIELLEEAHEKFPNSIKTLLKLAEDHLILTDNGSAMIAVDKILKLDNQNAEGFFMMGMIYRSMNEKEKAINSFQTAIEIEPELHDAWILIGQLYEDLGNKVALNYFEQAIKLDTTNINAWHSKAFYLQNNDRIPEALELYRKINIKDRQFEEAYLNAGILYLSMDSIDAAYEQFNILVNISPASYLGFYYRGITNELKGNISLATEDYSISQKINPTFEKAKKALQVIKK